MLALQTPSRSAWQGVAQIGGTSPPLTRLHKRMQRLESSPLSILAGTKEKQQALRPRKEGSLTVDELSQRTRGRSSNTFRGHQDVLSRIQALSKLETTDEFHFTAAEDQEILRLRNGMSMTFAQIAEQLGRKWKRSICRRYHLLTNQGSSRSISQTEHGLQSQSPAIASSPPNVSLGAGKHLLHFHTAQEPQIGPSVFTAREDYLILGQGDLDSLSESWEAIAQQLSGNRSWWDVRRRYLELTQ